MVAVPMRVHIETRPSGRVLVKATASPVGAEEVLVVVLGLRVEPSETVHVDAAPLMILVMTMT